MRQLIFVSICLLLAGNSNAQSTSLLPVEPIRFPLGENSTQYVKLSVLNQIWARNTQMNPGTTINGFETSQYNDISIRRLRFSLHGFLSERVYFYAQFGQNNFNFRSTKFRGVFFHDAIVEYTPILGKLSIGGGLTGWGGLTRLSTPSIGSLLALDAPLYMQATNGVNDQFLRHLSLYAKGQLGKLDYRIAITDPMTITSPEAPNTSYYTFADTPPKLQTQSYFKWMFWDKEGNTTPYQAGTYLGKKKILNIGAGLRYQPDATWGLDASDTVYTDMVLWGVDLFLDRPVGENQAITAYLAYTSYDFGQNYLRNVGVNNPAGGSNRPSVIGFGDAIPMVGTGSTIYAQAGFLFGEDILSENGKLQPFVTAQLSNYERLDDPMNVFEFGLNYLTAGTHGSKISLMYQSRPVFEQDTNQENHTITRKGMTVLQYQISF